MKKFKRVLSIILAGSILFLAACGNMGDGENNDNGEKESNFIIAVCKR